MHSCPTGVYSTVCIQSASHTDHYSWHTIHGGLYVVLYLEYIICVTVFDYLELKHMSNYYKTLVFALNKKWFIANNRLKQWSQDMCQAWKSRWQNSKCFKVNDLSGRFLVSFPLIPKLKVKKSANRLKWWPAQFYIRYLLWLFLFLAVGSLSENASW